MKARLFIERRVHVTAHSQARGFHDDRGVGRYAAREPDAGTDYCVVTNDRVAAEYRGTGIDHDTIFQRRGTLVAADEVAGVIGLEAQSTERHSLVELDVLADVGRLADDNARAVV